MPKHVVDLISAGLNLHQKSINGSKILIVGVAYKSDINDVRESPALDIIQLLIESGSEICWYDPFVDTLGLDDYPALKVDELSQKFLEKFDLCVIVTDHTLIDYELIKKHSKQIVDTRNVYKKSSKKIIKLGYSIH